MPVLRQLFYAPFDIVLAQEEGYDKQHYFVILSTDFSDYNTSSSTDYMALMITTVEPKIDNYSVDFNFHGKKSYIRCNKIKKLSIWEIQGKKPFIMDELTKKMITSQVERFFKEIMRQQKNETQKSIKKSPEINYLHLQFLCISFVYSPSILIFNSSKTL